MPLDVRCNGEPRNKQDNPSLDSFSVPITSLLLVGRLGLGPFLVSFPTATADEAIADLQGMVSAASKHWTGLNAQIQTVISLNEFNC